MGDTVKVEEESGPGGGSRVRGFCKCPECGFEMPHLQGNACRCQTCPECGSFMVRVHTLAGLK